MLITGMLYRHRPRLRRVAAALYVSVCVLLAPPLLAERRDLMTTLCSDGDFDTFCELIDAAGLVATLRERSPLTVFAPTDDAFARLSPAELTALRQAENRDRLRERLLYHIVAARLEAFDLRQERPAAPLKGKQVRFVLMHDQVLIDDAYIDREDIMTSNGIIHGIDKVLTP